MDDQRMTARMASLAEANRIRQARARLKRDLYGLPSAAESLDAAVPYLLEPPDVLLTMRAFDLVTACRRVGPLRAAKMFRAAGVPESRRLGDLTFRQRVCLHEQLLGTADRARAAV